MNAPKNIAASVRQRLLNLARKERRPFNELLQYYGMERFLYRLYRSDQAERYVLKGALMLRVWRSPLIRPTMDVDLLGRTSNSVDDVLSRIRKILAVEVEEDGIVFDAQSVKAERINENATYHGIRVRFLGYLGSARIPMQVDIGFGDIVYPNPEESDFPTILDFPAPRLLCYSRESSIAEKLVATVTLAKANSRMKDFYDIWLLSRQFNFLGADLAEAIRLTFEQREEVLPEEIEGFSRSFVESKKEMWTVFRERLRIDHAPSAFSDVVAAVDSFLSPVVVALLAGKSGPESWIAPGPWR